MTRKQKSRRTAAAAVAPAPTPSREKRPAATREVEPGPGLNPWALLAVAIAVVAALLYARSLSNGFVFDDGDIVIGDPHVRDLGNWRALLADSYRPLRTITYAIDYAIWGMRPEGFRITNIALHATNGILALFVARKVVGPARVAALIAALVLVLHPAQVESVAYISGRRDVLFASFYLAGFLCYTRFAAATALRERVAWLAGTGVAFLLSLMSKEMAASLPIACLLWDFYVASAPVEGGERPGIVAAAVRVLRARAVLFASAVVVLGAFVYYTLVVRRATTRVVGGDVEYWGGSLLNNLLTVPLTYAHYVKVALFPATLAAQYFGAFEPASGFTDPRVIPALLFLVGLVAAALFLMTRTRHRAVGFGIAWFGVTLAPASQIFPHHEIVADHYLYLPLLGVGIAIAGALTTLAVSERWRYRAYAAVAIVFLLLAARTYARIGDWRDEATLWEATFEAVPESPRAAYNLGFVATQQGDHERAVKLYKLAIQGEPTFIPAYRNLASTYGRLNRPDDARAVYEQALTIDLESAARQWHMLPKSLEWAFRVEIALIDARKGQLDAARDQLERVVAAEPDAVRAHDSIVAILQNQGRFDQTLREYQDRVNASPDDLNARLRLAYMLWKANRFDEGFAHAQKVLEANDESSLAHFLVAVYYGQVHPERAPSRYASSDHFDEAARWAPSYLDQELIDRKRAELMGAPRV